MDRARINEGIRRMRFEDLLGRHERGELGQEAAAEMLGISDRTFRRWRDRLHDEGAGGLADRRLGPSGRRAAQAEIERMLRLYRSHYGEFAVKHFHEQLVKRHGYKLGYTVTKVHLHRSGLVRPATKRSAHRKKRPRRPMVGMMLHQDASPHAWLPGDGRKYDLVVTLDDATSAIYSAFLVDEEGTASTFRGLGEVVARHGLFCSFYTDRGCHYFRTPEAGGKVSRTVLTQVGRALAQLGIEHIAAYSPQARGRSEPDCPRSWPWRGSPPWRPPTAGSPRSISPSTTQLSPWRPSSRARVSWPIPPACGARSSASRRLRIVGADNTIKYRNLRLQLPPSRLRSHFVKASVRVHEYPDGAIAVFWGPHRLADHGLDGAIQDHRAQAA